MPSSRPTHDPSPAGTRGAHGAAVLARGKVGRLRGLVRFFRDRDASLVGKAFVVLTAAYVVWPLDLLPDAAPVLGWLDDLGLVGFASAYLFRVADRYREVPPAESDPSI
ncbi:MAG: YkvA family protein [Polyangiaceae bacterium]